MSNILQNSSLKAFNTFGLDVKAQYFTEVCNVEELKNALEFAKNENLEVLILGGGSNVLLTQDIDGLVIKNALKGIQKRGDGDSIYLTAASGESWHEFVMHCVASGYSGVENLSLIPGTVGAAPMQNIGAYGVEIKDVFVSLQALNRSTLEIETFNAHDCQFGYRESVFKHEAKGKYVILSVTFKLSKTPNLKLSYGAIKSTLEEMGVAQPTIKDVSDAVIAIRRSKLPDPAVIGNSGSFFKNPELPKVEFEKLQLKYPNVPHYPVSDELIKVPAGWLIDQAGWKGKRRGDIGVHDKQALVLVNHGGGKGSDIAQLAADIQANIFEVFGVKLHTEVNII